MADRLTHLEFDLELSGASVLPEDVAVVALAGLDNLAVFGLVAPLASVLAQGVVVVLAFGRGGHTLRSRG